MVEGEMPAGEHSVIWKGIDQGGNQVASGIYLYQLRAGEFVALTPPREAVLKSVRITDAGRFQLGISRW